MKEKEVVKKKNKGLIVSIVILIILVLGLGGYIVYDKVLKEEPKEIEEEIKQENKEKEPVIEEPDFYDVSELVKNKYIFEIETTETDYIRISNNKVVVKSVYDEDFKEAKGIEGTPKYVHSMWLCSDCNDGTGYIVLTEEGNIYYSEVDYNTKGVSDFKKVNIETALNIYLQYEENEESTIVFPKNENTVIYAELEKGELIQIRAGENTNKTYKEVFPYPDLIISGCHNRGCEGLYVSPEKKLYNVTYKIENGDRTEIINEEEIKYNNNSIKVKDGFGLLKDIDDNMTSYYTYYIISQDNQIYKIEAKETEIKEVISVEIYKEKKVKEYSLTEENFETSTPSYVTVIYEDGTSEKINKIIKLSTLYHRYNK